MGNAQSNDDVREESFDFKSWRPQIDTRPPIPIPPPVMETSSRNIRIRQEIRTTKLWEKENDGFSLISSISFSEEDNSKPWLVTIKGPQGSPYEGGKYQIRVSFPDDFPSQSPEILFGTY